MEFLSYTLQQLINGLQLGAVYALIALGYTMVYGVLRLINFAHGDIFMFGTFVAYFCIARWHLPIYLVFMITIGATAALGVLVEKIAYKPLRAAPRISLLITAVGVSLFLEYFLSLNAMFTPNYIAFPRPFDVAGYEASLVVVTNRGAAVYPGLDEKEVGRLGTILGVEAYPTSINRGVPYVASGLIANSKNAVVGTQTTGPELVFITRALGV